MWSIGLKHINHLSFIELDRCGRNNNYEVLCIIDRVLHHWLSARAGSIPMAVSPYCSYVVEDGAYNYCAASA